MSKTKSILISEKCNNIKSPRGFIFATSNKTKKECLDKMIFGTDIIYAPVVIRIRKGDFLFLFNKDENTISGIFEAISEGKYKIDTRIWNGRYPYQVKVKKISNDITTISNADKIFKKFNIKRNTPIIGKKLKEFLDIFKNNSTNSEIIKNLKDKINENIVDIEEEIPIIESTTFWDFPKQSYGITPKGDNKYAGVTPALIIYNMVWRYTLPGELVVDPMCGSGTTIDVCKTEKRNVIGYDIVPTRPDIIQNDARNIPLPNNSVDMCFIDSPYGDNIKYNDHPQCLGNISAEDEKFYNEMEKVMVECYRILKPNKVLGWLIGDQWVRGKFTPVGFKIYEKLCKYFEPVDIICVSRRNQSSNTGMWHNRARRLNFYLRGFKYLIIVKKNSNTNKQLNRKKKINWNYYDRDWGK